MLALIAAVTTATAHGLLKDGDDKLAIRALVGVTGTVAMALPAALVGFPAPALWPWLGAAIALHSVYQLLLIRSYELSDFSIAFPIARGAAPVAATIIGVAFLDDQLSWPAIVGIVCVSVGIVSLSLGHRLSRSGLVAALLSGLLTAAYTSIDAQGVRSAPHAIDFIAWFFLLGGLPMMAIFVIKRGRRSWAILRREARIGLFAGLLSLISFGATLFALGLAPIGIVAGLRETCVLVSLYIARRYLGEPLGTQKVAAAILIALGAASVVLFS